MKTCGTLIVALVLYGSSAAAVQTEGDVSDNVKRDGGVVILSLGRPTVSDNILTWRYQIRNDSTEDVWICGDMLFVGSDVHLAEDNETLTVQRRLDRPAPQDRLMGEVPVSTYIRLRSGETRTERMSLSLPVEPIHVFSEMRYDHPLEYATRLALEIGYYEGDLPTRVLKMLKQAERIAPAKAVRLSTSVSSPGYVRPLPLHGGSLLFTIRNERVRSRSEHVMIPWTDNWINYERVLRLEANDVSIAYQEEYRGIRMPALTGCTRIQMKFNTSALEFFFPRVSEQTLLNSEEKRYLQSVETIVIKDQKILDRLANELGEPYWNRDTCISDRGPADLTCYRNDQHLTSFTARVADGSKIVTERGDIFNYHNYHNALQSLTMLTPEIQALNLRAQCAASLTKLWRRFRLYHLARYAPADKGELWKRFKGNGQIVPPEAYERLRKTYPRATDWCNAISRSYRVEFKDDLAAGRILRCPSSGKGKSCYAMNPKCLYNSPTDVVLLFEAKPGWNQHGGPELFTIDNHDPQGGLVLLNDGTVKFVRTEEDLKQLRWK